MGSIMPRAKIRPPGKLLPPALVSLFSDPPWWDDIIIAALSPPDAVALSATEMSVIRAHLRHEVLHSQEVRRVLNEKVVEVVRQIKAGKRS